MFSNMQALAIYLLAIATALCGTWVLQIAWRSASRKWHLVLAGWALVFTSLYIWSLTTAADKGVALGITAWVAIALLFLLRALITSPLRVERQNKKKHDNVKQNVLPRVTKSQLALNTLTVFLIGPLAGLAAMMLSTLLLLLMQVLGVEYTANLAISTMLFPVFWAALAVVLGYQQRLLVRLLTVAGVGFGSLLCLWVMS